MTTHIRRAVSGFTLLEVVVIIAVLTILATAITPAILQQVMDSKIETTRQEARTLHEAVVGRPDAPTFGFVGDMGRLPETFEELLRPTAGTLMFTTATTRGVGMGWKGPYVNVGDTQDDVLKDAFGRPYVGAATGQVRSAGPDGQLETDDDIVFPPTPPVVAGRVMVTVKRVSAEDGTITVDPPGYEVRLFYSANGQQAFLGDVTAPFVFENIPQGIHAVHVIRGQNSQLVAEDTIQVFGGATKLVEVVFRL